MQSTVQRHLEAINAGTITKTNVIGLRKIINAYTRQANGWSISRAMSKTIDEFCIADVEPLLMYKQPRVVGDLHASGTKLLQDKRYAKRFSERQRDIINNPECFRLIRFDRIGRRGEYAVPVYEMFGNGGDSFCFRNIPWQSGGNGPEIVEEN